MKASFKSIAVTFKKLFNRTPKVVKEVADFKPIDDEPMIRERIGIGGRNYIPEWEKNKKRCRQNKINRRRAANKVARKQRKETLKRAA